MKDGALHAKKVRVLIVDDSRTIRGLIRAILTKDHRIDVVGDAGDAHEAREKIKLLNPDVITLDIEMPKMDGFQFLDRIMQLRPMPVVIVSTRTTENSQAAIRALSLGAVDCVDVSRILQSPEKSVDLASTVRLAAASKPQLFAKGVRQARQVTVPKFVWNRKLVAIGASTGGVDALLTVLSEFPENAPPTVIAQHMPGNFLESFVARLDRHSQARVVLARNDLVLEQGTLAVAPGGTSHVAVSPENRFKLRLVEADVDALYIPSVDILFASAERHADALVAVMLTGMGSDGALAMSRLKRSGARTIVQDSKTAVIDGMPRAAREAGAACEVVPLPKIAERILVNTGKSTEVIR